jgi:methanogenic corrinoid protein MtbC1
LVGLSNEALRKLVAKDRQHREEARGQALGVPSAAQIEPARAFRACLDAVDALDSERLAAELRRATVHLPLDLLTDLVLVPLLVEIGRRWADGRLGAAQEHVASATILRVLGGMVRSLAPLPDAPAIVVGTPIGQRHELGALLVAVCAAAAGWRVTYLGADLPAAEVARAAEKVQASVVALSIVHPGSDEQLRADLDSLVDLLPPRRQLVLGGASVAGYARHLRSSGVLELESLAEFREFLSRRAAATA